MTVELEAGLITGFASLVLPVPSPRLSTSYTLCGQEGEGCLKLDCFQICCRVKRGLYGLQLCLFDGFLAFYSSAARERSSLPLHSGGWSFYRAAPSCDTIILKSRHGLHFVVGDWLPFGTDVPISAPCCLPLDLLHHWKSGVTFPLPVSKARQVSRLWCHRGAVIHVCDIMAAKCKFTQSLSETRTMSASVRVGSKACV